MKIPFCILICHLFVHLSKMFFEVKLSSEKSLLYFFIFRFSCYFRMFSMFLFFSLFSRSVWICFCLFFFLQISSKKKKSSVSIFLCILCFFTCLSSFFDFCFSLLFSFCVFSLSFTLFQNMEISLLCFLVLRFFCQFFF